MNSDKMFLASEEMLKRTQTINDLTKETQKIKREIKIKGAKIKNYGVQILKNLTPKKIVTEDITIPSRYGSYEDKIVFANYGIGLQSKWNSNATSLNETNWKTFNKIGQAILEKDDKELGIYLKPQKVVLLRKLLKNFHKLNIGWEKKEIPLSKRINYISNNMLSYSSSWLDGSGKKNLKIKDFSKVATLTKVSYFKDEFTFDDDKGRKIEVRIDNPRLEDALILEQIFDETKAFLQKEIKDLNNEEQEYQKVIDEIKIDFRAELMFIELAKNEV